MNDKTLLILCFLGDPVLPAVSVPNTGGFNADIKELLDFLSDTCWNCIVVTNTSIYLKEQKTVWSKNIQIYRIPIEDTYINQQEYLQLIFPGVLEKTETLCRNMGIQPALIHSYYWFSGYLAKQLSARIGVPFVHSAVSLSMDKINSGISLRSSIQTEWEHEFLPAAKAIFVITAQERKLLLQHYAVHTERILIVGRGVPEEFRHPQHDAEGIPAQLILPDDQRLKSANRAIPASTLWWNNGAYLFIGRLRESKGIDIIIRAWLRLYQLYGEHIAPLWIVGGTPDVISELREQLSKELSELEWAEERYKLVWWGYLSPAGISTLMLKSSVLLMHSLFEAGGRIILEAMSSRLPVIATPTGFAKDYVQDWVNGFLVDYGDMDALAQRMELFFRQPLLSNAMGNNAHQTFSQMEKQWNCYERHVQVYRAVSSQPDQPIPENLISLQEFGAITDFVKQGLLTAYPYCSLDKAHFESQLRNIVEEPIIPLEPDGHSNRWQAVYAGTPCVVKQFYSAMNEFALWGGDSFPKVLLAADQFSRAALSCEIQSIVPARKMDSEHFLLLMEHRKPLVPLMNDYVGIHDLLKQINAYPWNESLPKNPLGAPECFSTLSGRWHTLRDAASDDLCSEWTDFWEKIRIFLVPYWEIAETNIPTYCTLYGDSVWRHLCAGSKDGISLYPSAKLYWGERGFDQARLWLEREWFCGESLDTDTWDRYQLALSYADIPDKLFKSWCLCILCQGMQRGCKLKTGEEYRLTHYIDFLLKK